jgi:pyrroline-5-carboxylate reductase
VKVGFIGSGNMARALARGWGDPVLCTDSGSGRARALAAELGGEALESNRELAERADVVILAHKPAQLAEVAWEAAGAAKAVVSILARTPLADVRGAYPGVPVFVVVPNTAVEVRRGVLAFAASDAVDTDPALRDRLKELFARLGTVLDVPERMLAVAGACAGVGPAYWALLVEAQVEAAVRRGMPAALATELIVETMAGSAELIRGRDGDTLTVRREVASPGGTTARGLAALERGGVRAAFHSAMDDVVGG